MVELLNLPVTDDHIRFPFKNGFYEFGDLFLVVLVVRIGVEDDVSVKCEGFLKCSLECFCQS